MILKGQSWQIKFIKKNLDEQSQEDPLKRTISKEQSQEDTLSRKIGTIHDLIQASLA